MYVRYIFFAVLICLVSGPTAAAGEQDLERVTALAAAEYFLVLIDRGDYEKCWDESSELFRQSTEKLQWSERIAHLRTRFGHFIDRHLRYSKSLENTEGAPAGESYFMIYGSRFTEKTAAIEMVTVTKDPNGKWRVAGYSLQ